MNRSFKGSIQRKFLFQNMTKDLKNYRKSSKKNRKVEKLTEKFDLEKMSELRPKSTFQKNGRGRRRNEDFSNFQKLACSLLQDLKVLLKHFFEIQPLNRPKFDYRTWLPSGP